MSLLLGKCRYNNTCTCQRFRAKPDDGLICLYCSHYDGYGYHEETNLGNISQTSNEETSFSNILNNLRPQNIIPLQINQNSNSNKFKKKKYKPVLQFNRICSKYFYFK